MKNDYLKEYNKWLNNESLDKKTKDSLLKMTDFEKEDSFFKDLSFGTAGMRGIIGAGTNRFNVYTLRKANYGYAKYLISSNKKEIKIVIARDNRLYSDEFVEECVKTLSKFNIKCYVFKEITATPILSYAIRYLKADGGIVITASHNPKEYNGYKIYDHNGCQLTPDLAKIVIENVDNAPHYLDIEVNEYDYCVKHGFVLYVPNDLIDSYVNEVKSISNKNINKKDFSLVYSPLYGTGGKIACRLLGELGYNYIKVEEQFDNDPSFPTVKYPNPEDKDALSLSIEYAKKYNCDICLATDPDSDRIGIAVKNKNNEYVLLNGNQIGIIIFDYLCKNKNVNDSYLIDTLVSSRLTRKIAKNHNVNIISTFTGFKYIGKQIEYLLSNNKQFIFGYEESFGYVIKPITRDKDAFQPLILLSEIACFYKEQHKTLFDVLEDIYQKYGYYKEETISITFDGVNGQNKINDIMSFFRSNHIILKNFNITLKVDYLENDLIINKINLEKSDIIEFNFDEDDYVIFRPSGTEPKFKIYFGVKGRSLKEVNIKIEQLKFEILNFVSKYAE